MDRNKVLVFSLKYDTNLGDAIIGDSLIYLLNHNQIKKEILSFDLKCRNNRLPQKKSFIYRIFSKLSRAFNKSSMLSFYFKKFSINYRKCQKYYNHILNDVSSIIFAGGGIIECEHYDCDIFLSLITNIAEKKKINLIYNAVGFNGRFKNKFRYRKLKQCLNSEMVKYISIRENKSEISKYVSKDVDLVCDPACWSAEAFEIKKDEKSSVIGIGLIRPPVFKEFGIDFDEKDLLDLYYKILIRLQKSGFEYQLFTNGVKDDADFGVKLLKEHTDLKYREIAIPVENIDLLKIISNYRAILCARMHASICSYSLNVPSVSLCWNEKLKHFYSNIGYEDRCFNCDKFDCEIITEKLIECFQEANCGSDNRQEFRNTILSSIEKYEKYL